jgi:hypothetical protein
VLEEPVEIGNNVEDKMEIGRSKKDIKIRETTAAMVGAGHSHQKALGGPL